MGQDERLYAVQSSQRNGNYRGAGGGLGDVPAGLINRLVPTGQHLEAAEELAEKVLKAPPLAARAGVRLTRRQWVQPLYDANMYIQPLGLHLTEDFKEAGRSFVEKRPPEYQGR